MLASPRRAGATAGHGKVRKVRQTIDPKGGAAAEAREPASSIAGVVAAADSVSTSPGGRGIPALESRSGRDYAALTPAYETEMQLLTCVHDYGEAQGLAPDMRSRGIALYIRSTVGWVDRPSIIATLLGLRFAPSQPTQTNSYQTASARIANAWMSVCIMSPSAA